MVTFPVSLFVDKAMVTFLSMLNITTTFLSKVDKIKMDNSSPVQCGQHDGNISLEGEKNQHGQAPGQSGQNENNAPSKSAGGSQNQNNPTQQDQGQAGRGNRDTGDSGYGSGSVELYQQTLTPLCRATVMLLGPINAGKTCLVDTLLGRPLLAEDSTNDDRGDLSTCEITCTHAQIAGCQWKEGTEENMLRAQVANAVQSELRRPCRNRELSEEELQRKLQEMPTILEVLDTSGEFAFYKIHQMFLAPSMVFLLVMDVTKKLDDKLPESYAADKWKDKVDYPDTPRKFLNFFLNSISSFLCDDIEKSIFIVLTHTDQLEEEERVEKIKSYKRDVLGPC